ncbi:hypothetical protein BDAP_000761 [Binucleata daphniae]
MNLNLLFCTFFLVVITKTVSKNESKEIDIIVPTPNKVYMKIVHESIGGDKNPKTIVFDLFTTDCPLTTHNFTQLITGEANHKGNNISYKDATFHRIIYDFMIQGGDIINGDGTGSYSVYGKEFEDEISEKHKHVLGSLSMANHGPNTNGCQFFIVTGKCDHLNGRHTVFGKLADEESLKTVLQLSKVKTGARNKPITDVKIVDCGIYNEKEEEKGAENVEDKESETEESDEGYSSFTSSELKVYEEMLEKQKESKKEQERSDL